jgi:molybdopterin converting factor small subunit
MELIGEIQGFLAERVAGLLQEAGRQQQERVGEVLQRLRQAFQALEQSLIQLEETVHGWSIPNIDRPVADWAEQIVGLLPPPPPSPVPGLMEAVEAIDMAETQGALLQALLRGVSAFCDGLAVFIVRGNALVGWQGLRLQGVGAEPERFRRYSVSLDAPSAWSRCYETQTTQVATPLFAPADQTIVQEMAGYLPQVFALFPILVKGKPVGLLYADRRSGPWKPEEPMAIEILVRHAAMAVETMPSRLPWIQARKAQAPSAPAPTPPEASPDEKRLHEEAQRFARLLVQEIKMYNEQQVIMGRQYRDLYERLRDDIERSRKVYLERFPQSVVSQRDYFYEELVRVLADGDPSLLGIDRWPVSEG